MWFLYVDEKLIAESDEIWDMVYLIEALMQCCIVNCISLRPEKKF